MTRFRRPGACSLHRRGLHRAVGGGEVRTAGVCRNAGFSCSVAERMAALPANAHRAQLVAGGGSRRSISTKVEPAVVARDAQIGKRAIAAFPFRLLPRRHPTSRGPLCCAQNCASCHGVSGGGDGPAAEGLDPPPIAFDDVVRARERSAFALYRSLDRVWRNGHAGLVRSRGGS